MWRNYNLGHTPIFCAQGALHCHEKTVFILTKYFYPYENPYRGHSQILISIGFVSINKPKVNIYL